MRIIEKNGLDNLSVAEIAAEINLAPSAIYRHFGGKEEIIDSLITFVDKSLQENLVLVVGKEISAAEKLEMLYQLHTDFLKTQPAIPRIVFSLMATNKTPVLKQRIILVIASYVTKVRDILAQGQPGDIAPAIEPMGAAMLFIGMIQPLIILQTDDNLLDSYKQAIWAVYSRGIKT